jgi:hypothetical protein
VETRSEIVPVTLASGQTIQVEATVRTTEEDVAFAVPPIEGLSEAIEGLSASILESLKRIQPKKATVEFGIDIGLESGKLTALLVKGTGTASITVTLEWGE